MKAGTLIISTGIITWLRARRNLTRKRERHTRWTERERERDAQIQFEKHSTMTERSNEMWPRFQRLPVTHTFLHWISFSHLMLKEALAEVNISPVALLDATHWKLPVSACRSTAMNFRLLPSWKRRSESCTRRPSWVHENSTSTGSLTSQRRMALRPCNASWDLGSLENWSDDAWMMKTERNTENESNYWKENTQQLHEETHHVRSDELMSPTQHKSNKTKHSCHHQIWVKNLWADPTDPHLISSHQPCQQ